MPRYYYQIGIIHVLIFERIIFFLEASSVELIFKMGQSGSSDNKKENQFVVHDHESEHSGLLMNS